MAAHNELGKFGEELGKDFLTAKDFTILFRNWKYARYEVDIIASKKNVLHFVEIKTRRGNRFGFPEESVDRKKLQHLMNAAEEFQFRFPQWKLVQYDILSISINRFNEPEFFFIEDVYL